MAGLRDHPYSHDGAPLTGRLAMPEGDGPHPAILVMHDGTGLGSLVQRRASQMADAGYIALATDMYGPAARSGDLAAVGAIFTELQKTPGMLRDRTLAGYHALRALPGVDPTRIVAIGYCLGGQCVLELARSGADVLAVVSFHGLLATQAPAERGAVKARILSLTGAKDPWVPQDDVAAFQREMIAAEADWQTTIYGRGWHAFTDPEVGQRTDIPGVRYDPLLDRLSWAAATAFLTATLTEAPPTDPQP